jgi:hypothetical protein
VLSCLVLGFIFSFIHSLQLKDVVTQHNILKKEFSRMREILSGLEASSRSAILGPGAGPGAGADEWTEEQLMEVGAYRDLSARWSDLELDYASLQTEGEERAEMLEQRAASLTAQVDIADMI